MFNADFVNAIAALGVKANTNKLVPIDATRTMIVNADGTHQMFPVRVVERNTVKDFDSIASLYSRLDSNDLHKPEIWYTSTLVTFVHNYIDASDWDRFDRSTMSMPVSSPLALLQSWGKQQFVELKQIDLYMQIRTTFYGCLPDTPNLKELIGRVDIRKAQEATGTVKTGGVSMSRSLVAEASGADKLPELLNFRVPYWADQYIPLAVNIRAAFDLNPQTEAYRISIMPGEIEAAEREAADAVLVNIRSALGNHGVPVENDEENDKTAARIYHGVPS